MIKTISLKRALLPMLAALALPGTAAAAGSEGIPSLEQLFDAEIEGASRYAQSLADAPSTATLISAQDIERFGYRTLADTLNSVRGTFTTYDYGYSYLGARGISPPGDYSTRIQFLVDGARQNDAVYDQAMLGAEAPIDIDWVKRLEFISGPTSALYGGNALFGVANAMLWSGADINGTRITARTGSDGLLGTTMLAGHALDDGADWITGLSVQRSGGGDIRFPDFAVPGVSDGVARGVNGESFVKGFARYSNHGLRVTAIYALRNKDIPTAYYGTDFGVHGNTVRDEQAHIDAVYSAPLAAGWTQFFRFQFDHTGFVGDYLYSGATSRDESLSQWMSGEYRIGYDGLTDHRLQAGAEIRRNLHMDQKFYDLSPRVDYLDDHRSETTSGLYLQDEWTISRQWLLNIGLRGDRNDETDNMLSPRLALIYHPQAGTSVKLMHSRAFRPPNAYERFYTDGSSQKTSVASLKPERITATELTLDHALTPALRIGIGRYSNRIIDVIGLVTDPADGMSVFANQAPLHVRGWEFESEYQISPGWRARGSWTWQKIDAKGAAAFNSPKQVGKLFLDGPIADGNWVLATELQVISNRLTTKGDVSGNATLNLSLSQAREGTFGQWGIHLRNAGDIEHGVPVGTEYTQRALPQEKLEWLVRWSHRL